MCLRFRQILFAAACMLERPPLSIDNSTLLRFCDPARIDNHREGEFAALTQGTVAIACAPNILARSNIMREGTGYSFVVLCCRDYDSCMGSRLAGGLRLSEHSERPEGNAGQRNATRTVVLRLISGQQNATRTVVLRLTCERLWTQLV
jgi:hypothetical protein